MALEDEEGGGEEGWCAEARGVVVRVWREEEPALVDFEAEDEEDRKWVTSMTMSYWSTGGRLMWRTSSAEEE